MRNIQFSNYSYDPNKEQRDFFMKVQANSGKEPTSDSFKISHMQKKPHVYLLLLVD